MDRLDRIMVAATGVFVGSLLLDAFWGEGIQAEDINVAATIAVIVAFIYGWLTRKRAE
jgi:hypothetical protein